LPFEIRDDLELKEDNRYRYRYLDLRREKSKRILIEKNNFLHYIRNFFYKEEFIEIETPILSQLSPEGARSFLVPSNLKDRFYTLPQSPQIFKQILMISGFKKYYQIAKTFRNEDARSNRQLEFLQLDVEMSFANQNYYFNLIEKMLIEFLTKHLNVEIEKIKFDILTFEQCINEYGIDKPDLRNPLKIQEFPFKMKEMKNLEYFERGIFIEKNIDKKIDEIKNILNENCKEESFIVKKNEQSMEKIFSKSKENIKEEKFLNFSNGYYIIIGGEKESIINSLSKIINLLSDLFINKKNNSKEYRFL